MRKYFYLFGIIYTFLTFMVGWNHYQDNGFAIFNIGLMSFTMIFGLWAGFDIEKVLDEKDK